MKQQINDGDGIKLSEIINIAKKPYVIIVDYIWL